MSPLLGATARKKLLEFAETGRLRDLLQNGRTDTDVADLIVTICLRYCESRRAAKKRQAKP